MTLLASEDFARFAFANDVALGEVEAVMEGRIPLVNWEG